MLDHIKKLEIENAQLLSEKQEITDFETVIENLKKDHQDELDEINETLKIVLTQKDKEIQSAVLSAISRVHQQHTNKIFQTIKKEED
jgi:DNA-binding ferritin-like protein